MPYRANDVTYGNDVCFAHDVHAGMGGKHFIIVSKANSIILALAETSLAAKRRIVHGVETMDAVVVALCRDLQIHLRHITVVAVSVFLPCYAAR